MGEVLGKTKLHHVSFETHQGGSIPMGLANFGMFSIPRTPRTPVSPAPYPERPDSSPPNESVGGVSLTGFIGNPRGVRPIFEREIFQGPMPRDRSGKHLLALAWLRRILFLLHPALPGLLPEVA